MGYNFRMPNLNAALACAQLEQLDGFLENKRTLGVVNKIRNTKKIIYDDTFQLNISELKSHNLEGIIGGIFNEIE